MLRVVLRRHEKMSMRNQNENKEWAFKMESLFKISKSEVLIEIKEFTQVDTTRRPKNKEQ